MIGSDRIQAVAAYDGAFFPFFGVFNRKLGTPVRVNVLSGIVSTAFCVVGDRRLQQRRRLRRSRSCSTSRSRRRCSRTCWIFPAVAEAAVLAPGRAPAVPSIRAGMAGALDLDDRGRPSGSLLGSWVAVFPDTLEKVFGVDYGFKDTWGVLAAQVRGVHARHAWRNRADRRDRVHRGCADAARVGNGPDLESLCPPGCSGRSSPSPSRSVRSSRRGSSSSGRSRCRRCGDDRRGARCRVVIDLVVFVAGAAASLAVLRPIAAPAPTHARPLCAPALRRSWARVSSSSSACMASGGRVRIGGEVWSARGIRRRARCIEPGNQCPGGRDRGRDRARLHLRRSHGSLIVIIVVRSSSCVRARSDDSHRSRRRRAGVDRTPWPL